MSTAVRAIIMSSELIGFIILSIITIGILNKRRKSKYRNQKKGKATGDILYFTISFVILLVVFLVSYPSYVFLSYNKMILLSICVFISFVITMYYLIVDKNRYSYRYNEKVTTSYVLLKVISLILIFILASGIIDIEDKHLLFQDEEPVVETTIPMMFDEKKIGYTVDENGDINKYCFYYKQYDDWYYQEFYVSSNNLKIIEVENKSSYVEKLSKDTCYIKKERKNKSNGRFYRETEVNYIIYVNPNETVKIN